MGIVPAGHHGPRTNPWAAEPELMDESPEPDVAEDSGEDEASRGADPFGEDEASRGADPSGGDAGSSRSAPAGEDLQVISSSGDDDAFRVAHSRRINEGEEEEWSGNRGGHREPRTKALHDRNASAGRDTPREDAGGPQEEARASSPQPPKAKKRVWRAADE